MKFLLKLVRFGLAYREAITMPVRVVAKLMEEERRRGRRISKAAKDSKAWPMVNMMEID